MRSTRILAAVVTAAALGALVLPAAAANASTVSRTPAIHTNVTGQNCGVNGSAALSLQNKALGDMTRAVNVFGGHVPGSLLDGRTYSKDYSNEDLVNLNTTANQPYESVYQFNFEHPGILSSFLVTKFGSDPILTNAFAPLGHVYAEYMTWVPNHGVRLESNPTDLHALWIVTPEGAMISAASANAQAPSVLTVADNKYTSGPNKGRWHLYVEGLQQQGGLGNLADAQTWTADFCYNSN